MSKKLTAFICLSAFLFGGAYVFDAIVTPTAEAQSVKAEVAQQVEPAWMKPVVEEEKPDQGIVCEELGYKMIVPADPADVPESDISKEQMMEGIIAIWELYYEDEHVRKKDKRRRYFEENASDLADAIIMYQNEPTDIGGQLPKHWSTHYLLAVMVTYESAVDRFVDMGAMEEVGMLQIHGAALGGYDPEVVHRSPRLGLMLGVRWLASRMTKCMPEGYENSEWEAGMWLGTMSVYAAGERAMRKNGTCGNIHVARERVDKARMYRPRVEYKIEMYRED